MQLIRITVIDQMLGERSRTRLNERNDDDVCEKHFSGSQVLEMLPITSTAAGAGLLP
jgi:hypothetical protein